MGREIDGRLIAAMFRYTLRSVFSRCVFFSSLLYFSFLFVFLFRLIFLDNLYLALALKCQNLNVNIINRKDGICSRIPTASKDLHIVAILLLDFMYMCIE